MNAACVTALLAGSVVLPAAVAAPSALAAETCRSAIPTYVHDTSTGPEGVLRKYLDWDPLTGNAASALLDTGMSTPLDRNSRFFTGGNGIIYVITPEGTLQKYQDETASGGELLTFVRDVGSGWDAYSRVWSSGGNKIFALGDTGLTVYTMTLAGSVPVKLAPVIPSTNPAVAAMTQADDVWAVGTTIYTLKRGIADKPGDVKAWTYDSNDSRTPFSDGSTTVVHGIGTKTRSGWSPGPGTIYTVGDTPDYTGIARSYTGSTTEMDLANAEVGAGLYGDVQADIASCLASPSADAKPGTDTVPPETETPPPAVTDETADPAPQDPTEFSGKFVLGDGTPAAGLPVKVEAADVTSENDEEVAPIIFGSTVTAADGTWTLPLPQSLPAAVKQAAAENGGAINATASVDGQTASGQIMLGTDTVSAAPASAPSAVRALVSTAAENTADPSKLRPVTDDMFQETTPEPTQAQMDQSWAAKDEAVSVDTLGDRPLPEYQSDTGAPSQTDPYVIDGVDTKSMAVTPMDGGCDKASEKLISKKIYYTTVAEGHAYWDAKATVDYDSKLSTNVEVAVKTGSKWTIEGSVTLGSSMSVTTGYTNKGPMFAKQWKVPIEYKKTKEKWVCNYGRTVMYRYKIKGGKYKVPSGGAVGKYGKDVISKDGWSAYNGSPKSHRAYVPAGAYFQISKNKSIKWSGAVSAHGVKLGASTQYDKDHRQRITAGTKTNARHDIWGKNDRVSGKPGVFYSY